MKKQWVSKNEQNPQLVKSVSIDLNVNEMIANLLVNRGILTKKNATLFFSPSLNDLYDPYLIKDMYLAVERIEIAINTGEKVLVYGDYDVDGTTAVALVYSFFKDQLGVEVDFYVPDRFTEGYGISSKGIEYAAEKKCTLIIALDCGIKAVDKVADAKKQGIDFIICDHHTPDDELPEAIAIIDPKRFDCDYPCDYLSGCGLGFKLIQAIAMKRLIPFENIYGYLDLVAVSIASDIVPILDENRILTIYGLKVLEDSPRLGLKKLKDKALLSTNISISDIVFKIGPRINASGRVGSASDSVRLLIAKNEIEATELSNKLEKMNKYRKGLDQKTTEEAINLVESSSKLLNAKALVVYQKHWNKGVLGIVASRLVEKFYKPSIVLSLSEGKITGSARSVSNFDIYNAISYCSEFLLNFGGHKYAAGLTLAKENIENFTDRFLEVVNYQINEIDLIPKIMVDGIISLNEINDKFCDMVQQFKPFGPKNLKPVFVTKNVIDYGTSRTVGKNNDHLKLAITSYDSASKVINGIAFSMGHFKNHITKGNPFDICYTIQENDFWGRKEYQLVLQDIKLKEG